MYAFFKKVVECRQSFYPLRLQYLKWKQGHIVDFVQDVLNGFGYPGEDDCNVERGVEEF